MKKYKLEERLKMKFCTKCVMPDTRPRLTYDENGICNACEWKEIKETKVVISFK